MSSPIHSYRDLIAWQKAVDFAVDIYSLTRTFPRSEIYGLSSQLQRAAVSVASNIAEGHSRSTATYLHHLGVSNGSLRETETDLIIANRVGFSKVETHVALLAQADEIGRLIYGLTRSVERSRSSRRP
jgi:four helix bundle protein